MQTATRRVLWALLLFHAIGGMASAQDVITISGAVTTRADGLSVSGTAASAGATATTNASGGDALQVRCALKPAPPPRLHVDVVFEGQLMPRNIEAVALMETAVIWAAYGVDIRAVSASDGGRDSAVRLTVMFDDHPNPHMAAEALGSIQFLDGVPEPAIVIHTNAIAELISNVRVYGKTDREWPMALRDLLVGRVIGRALAHEIGHFLLRSRHHPEIGLMRASHPMPDLVSPDRRHFVLSADEVTRLASVTLTSLQVTPGLHRPRRSHDIRISKPQLAP